MFRGCKQGSSYLCADANLLEGGARGEPTFGYRESRQEDVRNVLDTTDFDFPSPLPLVSAFRIVRRQPEEKSEQPLWHYSKPPKGAEGAISPTATRYKKENLISLTLF
ncbi:hypothetical protein TNCT_162221 [Trichonephila clavata]|uniref:Uncharacterized protein n=1 Tax=Trichonephila clavata TaxID=2740835 RepID=A0A8X6J884_TRICU|nr:hypothetical protein TNCT_162221 [Trichonephila clavata]